MKFYLRQKLFAQIKRNYILSIIFILATFVYVNMLESCLLKPTYLKHLEHLDVQYCRIKLQRCEESICEKRKVEALTRVPDNSNFLPC